MTSRRWEELVAIGVVIKPQGRKGEVAVQPLTDRPDRFPSLKRAFLPVESGLAREVAVESAWPHKGRFVVKLAGVSSIDEAEPLRGLELRIGPEELAALPEGSYYHHQLVGLRVVDAREGELGEVHSILETGAGADVLVVRGARGEVLVPLAVPFVQSVDLQAGRLSIDLPGVLELVGSLPAAEARRGC